MKSILLCLIILFQFVGLSQVNQKDSLHLVLKNTAKNDTTYCNVLNALIDLEQDDKLWPSYNDEIISIAEVQLQKKDIKPQLFFYYKKVLAGALNNLGYLKKFQGDIPGALEYYYKSLKLYEEIDYKTNVSALQNNIGFIYKDQGDIKKALDYFLKNLKYFKEHHDSSNISLTLNNIGIVYIDNNQFDDALKCYEECINILNLLNNRKVKAYALNNVGFIYFKKYGLKQNKNANDSLLKIALDYFHKSLSIRESINDKRGICISLQNIAEALFAQNNLSIAKTYAEKSLKIAQEIGYPDNIKRTSNVLSKIYANTNNWKGAYDMQVLFKQMSDSLNNESNKKLSIQKGFQYQYEKKAAADSVKVAEEKKVVQAQLDKEKTQRFALYGGLLLVIIFSVFMVNRFLVTNKQKQIIELKEKETQHQNEIIIEQKALVEEKQKEILDSINYAKRIQYTLLAHSDFLKEWIPNHFIYFNPKDIVSGDFYWVTKQDKFFYLAVCDSTGHGVPGAFMSLMNIGFLSEAINEKNILEPGEVLNYVRNRLISSISKDGQKDGFDGILLRLEIENNNIKSVCYAAANNAPVHIKNNELIELPKDKMPVGKGEKEESFTTHYLEVNQGETIYLYTDGYADQFGGPKGKKFKYKPLNEMLVANTSLELEKQKQELEQTFNTWKSNLEQVDDVLVVGVKL